MTVDKKRLRKALFGYRKKDVTEYIDSIVSDFEKVIEEQKNEIAEIKRQNQTLMAENSESFKKIEEMQKERDYISKAVISAELRAKKVIEDAEAEMATLKANKAAEIALADEELKKLKENINNLKLSAVATLKEYEAQMNDLIDGGK